MNVQRGILPLIGSLKCVSTATWVGGGFILGIAEATYNPTLGAVWALMPVPYIVTFFLGEYQVHLHLGYWATAVNWLHDQCVENTYSSAVSCSDPAGPQSPQVSFPVNNLM